MLSCTVSGFNRVSLNDLSKKAIPLVVDFINAKLYSSNVGGITCNVGCSNF